MKTSLAKFPLEIKAVYTTKSINKQKAKSPSDVVNSRPFILTGIVKESTQKLSLRTKHPINQHG